MQEEAASIDVICSTSFVSSPTSSSLLLLCSHTHYIYVCVCLFLCVCVCVPGWYARSHYYDLIPSAPPAAWRSSFPLLEQVWRVSLPLPEQALRLFLPPCFDGGDDLVGCANIALRRLFACSKNKREVENTFKVCFAKTYKEETLAKDAARLQAPKKVIKRLYKDYYCLLFLNPIRSTFAVDAKVSLWSGSGFRNSSAILTRSSGNSISTAIRDSRYPAEKAS